MLIRKILLCLAGLLFVHSLSAQRRQLTLDLFGNATTLPTHPVQIFKPVHPGLTIGMEFPYNDNTKHRIGQTVKLGLFYHQLVQTGVQLYSELHYSYQVKGGFGLDAQAGIGYIHSIPNHQIFKLNNGVYEKKTNLGKPEFMGSIAIGAGYYINPEKTNRIFASYQFWLQAPFVNQYVPVLPNTALHIGYARTLSPVVHKTITPVF